MKKILVIDDEPDARTLLSNRLSASGFQVVEAADGLSGVEAARQGRPDLILLDVLMPSQDGVETYHALRQDPATKTIPVIFLTALVQNILITQKSLDLGGSYAILGKPYRCEELIREVRKALGEPVGQGGENPA